MRNVYILFSSFILVLCGYLVATPSLALAAGTLTTSNEYYNPATSVLTYTIVSDSGVNWAGVTTAAYSVYPNNGHDYKYTTSGFTNCDDGATCTVTLSQSEYGDPALGTNVLLKICDNADCFYTGSILYDDLITEPVVPITVDETSQNAITGLLANIVSALTDMIPVALPIVAVVVVSMSAIFFLWKLARHFLGN